MAIAVQFGTEVLGDMAAQFAALPEKVQVRIAKEVIDVCAMRARQALVAGVSGQFLHVQRGKYRSAWAAAEMPPARMQKSKGRIIGGVVYPTRAGLGISADNPYYFPIALEYGFQARTQGTMIRPGSAAYAQVSGQIAVGKAGKSVQVIEGRKRGGKIIKPSVWAGWIRRRGGVGAKEIPPHRHVRAAADLVAPQIYALARSELTKIVGQEWDKMVGKLIRAEQREAARLGRIVGRQLGGLSL